MTKRISKLCSSNRCRPIARPVVSLNSSRIGCSRGTALSFWDGTDPKLRGHNWATRNDRGGV